MEFEEKAESLINPWSELGFRVIQPENMKTSLRVSEV